MYIYNPYTYIRVIYMHTHTHTHVCIYIYIYIYKIYIIYMLDTQRLLTLWGTLSLLYAYNAYHNETSPHKIEATSTTNQMLFELTIE